MNKNKTIVIPKGYGFNTWHPGDVCHPEKYGLFGENRPQAQSGSPGIMASSTETGHGVWEFLEVSEYTKSWIEAQKLNKQQISTCFGQLKKH